MSERSLPALRLQALRDRMQREDIDYVLIPTSDHHQSEYVAPHFKTRAFFSGFTGSNGTLVVGREDFAGLWTDGRYFVQAEKELEGSTITLFRMEEAGVPTIRAFLKDKLGQGGRLAFDGRCVPYGEVRSLRETIGDSAEFVTDFDPADGIWTDRPPRPSGPVFLLDEKTIAGETAASKLRRLRETMKKEGAGVFVTGKLEDICWLLNIRGSDVECNPVVLSYLVVEEEGFSLFLQDVEVQDGLPAHIEALDGAMRGYDGFLEYLERMDYAGRKVLIDLEGTSCATVLAVLRGAGDDAPFAPQAPETLIDRLSPIVTMKAVKNETEQNNARAVYLEDSVVLTKYIYWLRKRAEKALRDGDEYLTDIADGFAADGEDSLGAYLNEYTAAMKLDDMRRGIADYVDLSFSTIVAYGPNAAMAHYQATEKDHAELRPEGMFLVDSGGNYLRGTTDVTRTIAVGPVTEEMRRDYTLTLAGEMALQNAVFLEGCTGRNLDILARLPLWQAGIDYKHGTGHGIGAFLGVHEGPQRISWQKQARGEVAMEAGMIVSDEPGVYRPGEYGIRIETILLTVPRAETSDGRFLAFEPLTFVPLDRRLILPDLLTEEALEQVNVYQATVYEKLAPHLTQEEREWLSQETAPLG